MSNYPDNFDGAACDEVNGEYERDYPTVDEVEAIALQFATKAATDFDTWLEVHAPWDGHHGLERLERENVIRWPNGALSFLSELIAESMMDRISTQYRREMEK